MPEDFPDSAEELLSGYPDSIEASRVALIQRQATARILEIITTNATTKKAGRRAFALAHALKLGTCRTQRDLAAKLRVSPGRISQILNEVEREIGL